MTPRIYQALTEALGKLSEKPLDHGDDGIDGALRRRHLEYEAECNAFGTTYQEWDQVQREQHNQMLHQIAIRQFEETVTKAFFDKDLSITELRASLETILSKYSPKNV